MRCSPFRAITYYQALIISAPARAFPRPRGSFGNALSKASQWKICKGFGTSNYQVVKILTTTKSLESEKQWHTPRPFQQGSAPRPLYWGSALRSLAQEIKLFLVDSTPINFSFSWLSSFALFSILTLGWNKVAVFAGWKSVFRAKLPFLWFTTYHLIKGFFQGSTRNLWVNTWNDSWNSLKHSIILGRSFCPFPFALIYLAALASQAHI